VATTIIKRNGNFAGFLGLLKFFKTCYRFTLNTLFISLPVLCSAQAHAACEQWVAKVIAVQGSVERNHNNGSGTGFGSANEEWQPLLVDQVICPGESVRLAAYSRAALYLSNNTFLRLDEKSLISFPQSDQSAGFLMDLRKGIGHFISRIKNRFEIATPYTNAAVDGTEFVIAVNPATSTINPATSTISIIEGTVSASAPAGQYKLHSGEQLVAAADFARQSSITVNPRDSVSWAVYYPPILTLQDFASIRANPRGQELLSSVANLLQADKTDKALNFAQNFIDSGAASDQQQAEAKLLLAAILLNAGQPEQANDVLDEVINDAGNNADNTALAYALKTLYHAIVNEPDIALINAEKARQREATSAAVYIALSYAHQSAQQLVEANTSAHTATQVAPDNPLAWNRLGETELMLGDLSAAANAVQQALTLDPERPESLTLAGLIKIMQLEIEQGKALLTKSLNINSTNPDTRLAMALAFTREGEIAKGRQQLEYAASLNPANSIIRSYLGRIYFEQNLNEEADAQWQLAKEFDPLDPTPHFYEGVQKLFENNPVGALESIEKSQELNANRGVYRSEALLQSDAATRSATLARAYAELNFDQSVTLQGVDALTLDPANADGHRLLADRYRTLSRHETARVSELLQAQLWQPLTAYPLQPQLSERNLAIVSGLGPARPGLNEFHPLFSQNGLYGLLNGFYGSDDSWGNDAVVSGLFGPVAVSFGQYHFETDGFRDNAGQQQDIYNGLVHWQATPATNLQLEYRQFDWDRGDLGFGVVQQISDTLQNETETKTLRFGLRHALATNRQVLFSLISQSTDNSREFLNNPVVSTDNTDAEMAEIQFLQTAENYKLQAGFGYLSSEFDIFDQPGTLFASTTKGSQNFKNAYTYLYVPVSNALSTVLGISYDNLSSRENFSSDFFGNTVDSPKYTQWSPKFGFSYQFNPGLRIRAAYFRRLMREIASGQTIEPTQIVGFNQLYDDNLYADSSTYGFGLDIETENSTRLGFESNYREIDIRISDPTGLLMVEDLQQFELDHRIYFYQPISNMLAVDLGFNFEDLEFDYLKDSAAISRLKTQDFPAGLNVFLDDFIRIRLEAQYVNQKIEFNELNGTTFALEPRKNTEELWLGNTAVSFRLPNKLGNIELGVDNVTDRKVSLIEGDQSFLRVYPRRFFYGRLQLAF